MGSLFSSKHCLLSLTDLELTGVPVSLLAKPGVLNALCTIFLRDTQTLHCEKWELAASDVVLAELVNNRGPAALLRARSGDADSQLRLAQLGADLTACGQLLVLTTPKVDMVLIPRQACSAEEGSPFVVFLTRVAGVEFMAGLISSKQVGLVLDLDATLLESEQLTYATRPSDWFDLDWHADKFVSTAQELVPTYLARLPDEAGAESTSATSWVTQNLSHDYRVRVRPGWSALKGCLTQAKDKFRTSVCSLGRPIYVQAVTTLLDPAHEIIAKAEFGGRVISARPDGTTFASEKTPAIAVGLAAPNSEDYNMRFAPMVAVDDIPEYYPAAHRDIVYKIEPYRPTGTSPSGVDAGDALQFVTDLLQQFWTHCYGITGEGGAISALKLCAANLLQKLQGPADDSTCLLVWEYLFDSMGRNCWAALSVDGFLQLQAEQADMLAQGLEGLQQENMPDNPAPVQRSPGSKPASPVTIAEKQETLANLAAAAAWLPLSPAAATVEVNYADLPSIMELPVVILSEDTANAD